MSLSFPMHKNKPAQPLIRSLNMTFYDLGVSLEASASRRSPRGSGYSGVPSTRSPQAILGTPPAGGPLLSLTRSALDSALGSAQAARHK